MATTPMFAPDGSTGDIPIANVEAAQAAGFKKAVSMRSPDGKTGFVPEDRWLDATKAGFAPISADAPQLAGSQMKQSVIPKVVRATTASLPGIGAVGGGAIAAPGVVSTPLGVGFGAALGESARLALNNRLFGSDEPTNYSKRGIESTVKEGLVAGGTQGAFEALGPVTSAAGNLIDRATGATSDIAEAEASRAGELEGIETAKNANLSRYQLEEQKVAEANQQAQIKYTQSLQEARAAQETAKNANISKYLALEQETAEARTAQAAQNPPLADAEQQSWRDLNTAIRAPASSVKIGLGRSDLSSAAAMPGRGLANEGFDAAALSKLNPVEQAALIGPKYQVAGKAVSDTIAKATEGGITFDAGKSAYDIFEKIPNPKLQEKAIEAFNETASDIGIVNQRQATPQEAWQLRRALQANARFGPGGDLNSIKGIGTQLYRAVTNDLHEAVPELVPVDQHYADMKEAVKAIQKNVAKFGANIPPAASKAIEDLNVSPYKPLPQLPEPPTPEALTVSPYKPLPPTPPPVNTAAIRRAALLRTGRSIAPYAAGAAGVYGAYRVGDAMKGLMR